MPVIINASPTNGLVQTADGSGIVKLQSNGVTTNALAWVNFNGTGTVAIRSSYNVSSITDNGTGDYTVNFATALSDANYAVTGLATFSTTTDGSLNIGAYGTNNILSSSVRFRTYLSTNEVNYDAAMVSVAIFGN
jgi:uncharacterized protein (AIM24 family)